MKFDPILIVGGEPNSIFSEILFKTLKKITVKKPIILISSYKLLKLQMKELNYRKNIKLLEYKKLKKYKLNNNSINLIDIEYNGEKAFEKISIKSNKFIRESFDLAFELIKREKIKRFINGPISKKNFLNKKFLGITEYISKNFSTKNTCMLIFNEKIAVCPVTTHLPLKLVHKKINKKNISQKVNLINDFYIKKFGFMPEIAILGLNPHCESIYKFNEDERIIKPLIKILRKKYKI